MPRSRAFFEDDRRDGETTTALARHWRDAGEPSRAVEYFVRAGESAELGWAKDQAAILYREALGLVAEDDPELTRSFASTGGLIAEALDARSCRRALPHPETRG